MKKIVIFLIINFFLWGTFLAIKNQAQAAISTFPDVTPEILKQNPNYLFTYIQGLYNFGLGIVGMLALVMIVFGAVQYAVMSAASPDKKRDALGRIYSALWGLLLLFGAYLILTTINPQLVTLQISGVTSTQPIATTTSRAICGDDYKDFQETLAKCKKINWTDYKGTKYFYYLFYGTGSASTSDSGPHFIPFSLTKGDFTILCYLFKQIDLPEKITDKTEKLYDDDFKICTN